MYRTWSPCDTSVAGAIGTEADFSSQGILSNSVDLSMKIHFIYLFVCLFCPNSGWYSGRTQVRGPGSVCVLSMHVYMCCVLYVPMHVYMCFHVCVCFMWM